MEQPESAPAPKRRHLLRRWLLVFTSLFLIALMGVIWTRLTLKADPNVTDAEHQALERRLDELQPLTLGLWFPVDSRVVQYSLERDKAELVAYAVDYYSVFGLRLRRVELNCWDARPGIDGAMIGETEYVGTLTGTVWCENAEF